VLDEGVALNDGEHDDEDDGDDDEMLMLFDCLASDVVVVGSGRNHIGRPL
jgi:hypothetical protein